MNWQVFRSDFSGYLGPDFELREKERLQDNLPITYLSKKTDLKYDNPFVWVTSSNTPENFFTSSELEQCQLIIHPNSGYNNFSAAFVKSFQKPIIIGHHIRAAAVVTTILSYLFQTHSPLPQSHQWEPSRKYPRQLLHDKKIQIIGFGHIGKLLHQCLEGLAGTISIYDPFKNEMELKLGCDIIILCAGLNPSSHYLIDKNFLQHLPSNFTLVNTARGPLINQTDLIKAIGINPQANIYLDVFENEPHDLSLFKSLKNVQTSSHIAGVFDGIDEKIIDFEHDVLKDFFDSSLEDFLRRYDGQDLQNRIHNNFLI